MLKSAHLDVLTYHSGGDFLENGLRHKPDCLVLDIQMPVMTGLELCHQLETSPDAMPIVVITAHDDEDIREEALGAGAAVYLIKPFSDDELLAAINVALEQHHHSHAK